jgi:hypothetical protein
MKSQDSPEKNPGASIQSGWEQHFGPLAEFGAAVRELLHLHEQQFQAIVHGDTECSRFEPLIHMANEKKQLAKYAYLRNLDSPGDLNEGAQ